MSESKTTEFLRRDVLQGTAIAGLATLASVKNLAEKLGLFSRDIKTMDDLFVHTLRDIYYAEKQIVKSLPEMVEKATDTGLKRGFQEHLKQTENHVKRLERCSRNLEKNPRVSIVLPSTGLSTRQKTLPARSTTKPCWTQHSSRRRRPSSTTK